MKLFTATDIGRRRGANEDSFAGQCVDAGLCWAAVCDGMGGERGGAVASSLACSEIERVLLTGIRPGLDEKTAQTLLQTALENANSRIYEQSKKDPNLSGMGTTAVIVIVDNDKAHIMHAGDSRAYKITSEGIKAITKDHSVVQILIDRGDITIEEAKTHRDRHLITKAVGADPQIKGDYTNCKLNKGDILLLCSDGLYNMIDNEEIYKLTIQAVQSLDASVLTKQANAMGGLDNITAAVIYAD